MKKGKGWLEDPNVKAKSGAFQSYEGPRLRKEVMLRRSPIGGVPVNAHTVIREKRLFKRPAGK